MNKRTFSLFLVLFAATLFLLVRLLPKVEEIKPYGTALGKTAFDVLTLEDHGPHSFREAIIEANKARKPGSIHFRLAGTIKLEHPLPPLLNNGTTVKADREIVIDAGLVPKNEQFWVIKGKGQIISNVVFRGNGNEGVLLLAGKSRVEKCTFEGFARGIVISADNCSLDNSRFYKNGRGIEVMRGARFTHIASNIFRGSSEAGIWAVWSVNQEVPAFLGVEKNSISDGSTGMVLSIDRGRVAGNDMSNNKTAVTLMNSRNIEITQNRLYGNKEYGLLLDGSFKNRVTNNTAYRNSFAGILMKRSAGNLIEGNHLFSNELYGVADVLSNLESSLLPNHIKGNLITDNNDGVYLMASSAVIKGNEIKGNISSGIRIEAYINSGGNRYDSVPLMEGQKSEDRVVLGE